MTFKKLMTVIGVASACLMGCAGGGGASSAPAVPAGPFTLPEGMAAVHYYRPGGDYNGWGLHSWESFQSKEEAGDEWAKKNMADRPLPGVTWFTPIKPAAMDDFGEVFLVPAGEFGNGRVNYILHKGDKKDQCNKDMFWLLKDSKEIWVNQNDCHVYTSKDAAIAARKK